MKSEAPQHFTIFRTRTLMFPLYLPTFFKSSPENWRWTYIAPSELCTHSTRTFSTISSGNLLHAFKLMSVCASTWRYTNELLTFWSTPSRFWESRLWGSAPCNFGGFSSSGTSLFLLSAGFTELRSGLREATLYFFDNSTTLLLWRMNRTFLKMFSTTYEPSHF